MNIGIDDFLAQLGALLNRPPPLNFQGIKAANSICHRLESEIPVCLGSRQPSPLSDVLQQVSESVDRLPYELQGLVNFILKSADFFPWYQRSAPVFPAFMEGHANAEIIGPRGLVIREDVAVGVTIMRPRLTYPDHHHSPEEIYIVLSEGLWRQNGYPWISPGPGGYVYNPPDILHSMKSLETPLFAIWCLNLD